MLSIKKTLTNILTSVLYFNMALDTLANRLTTATNNISTLTTNVGTLTNTVNNLNSYARSSVNVVSTYARSSGQTFTIEKAGHVAAIKITAVTALPGRQDVTIATLPDAYNPNSQILKFLITPTASGVDNTVRITINTDGSVTAYWYGASGSTSGNLNIQEYIPYIST